MNDYFTDLRAFSAEGARVGLITCRRCGAVILIDPADTADYSFAHIEWHREMDR